MQETETVLDDASFVEETVPNSDVQTKFYYNFALLTFLYMLQGVPLGLAGGSLPFLLKVSCFQFSVFSLFF
jgi:hypothetical protein